MLSTIQLLNEKPREGTVEVRDNLLSKFANGKLYERYWPSHRLRCACYEKKTPSRGFELAQSLELRAVTIATGEFLYYTAQKTH